MFQSRSTPFEEDVEKATSENNLAEDWSQIILICDNAVNYQDGAKFCLKAIMKRLHHSVPRVVLQALILLDSCVKNCDRRFLLQVASSEFTAEVRKLLGKMHPSCATKLKELLQKWSMEEFKDDPELCIIPSLYYKLKSEGVEFPSMEKEKKIVAPISTDPNAVTSQEEENDIIKAIEISLKDTGRYSAPIEEATSRLSLSQLKPRREAFKVLTLYDFEAVEENELTLKAGEIVLVTDDSDSNWWKGTNQLTEGLFPSNFVSEEEYLRSLQPKAEASPPTETKDTSDDIVTICEKKIDLVLNWLNDVDPTEELTDPEDMVKLEKECYRMAPLIEENLHAIDNRLAMLDATNEKIMASFDLFHDLSIVTNQWATLPSNMTTYSSTMQIPFAQHTMPQSVVISGSSMPPQHTIMSQNSVASNISSDPAASNQQNEKTNNSLSNQLTNPPSSSQTIGDHTIVSPTSLTTTAAANLPINQAVPPACVLNPYATNIVGGMFVPPGIPYPFPPNPQQGYMPFPTSSQAFVAMPYTVPPMGSHMPYPYYYVNNTQPSVQVQSNNFEDPSISQSEDVTSNTSTSVSNVLSPTSSTSLSNVSSPTSSTHVSTSSYFNELQQMTTLDSTAVLTPSSTKQDTTQNIITDVSKDGQLPNSSSNGESS